MKRRYSSSYCVQVSDNSALSDQRELVSKMKEELSVTNVSSQPEDDTTSNEASAEEPLEIASRAYQMEMLQQSLKQNIIVAVCYQFYTCIYLKAD